MSQGTVYKTKAKLSFLCQDTRDWSVSKGILLLEQYRRKWRTVSTSFFFRAILGFFTVFSRSCSADPFVQCICWWRCFLDCFLAFLRAFMTLLLAFNVTGDIMNRSTINEREIKELPVQMVLQGLFCGLHEKEKKGIPRSKDERLIIHMIYEAAGLVVPTLYMTTLVL